MKREKPVPNIGTHSTEVDSETCNTPGTGMHSDIQLWPETVGDESQNGCIWIYLFSPKAESIVRGVRPTMLLVKYMRIRTASETQTAAVHFASLLILFDFYSVSLRCFDDAERRE